MTWEWGVQVRTPLSLITFFGRSTQCATDVLMPEPIHLEGGGVVVARLNDLTPSRDLDAVA